jgi:hypothetical protein
MLSLNGNPYTAELGAGYVAAPYASPVDCNLTDFQECRSRRLRSQSVVFALDP